MLLRGQVKLPGIARQGRRTVTARCDAAKAPSVTGAALEAKKALLSEVAGSDRGIFGLPAAKKASILQACQALEAHNPVPDPVLHLDQVQGDWRLLYSTITILGTRRTKLGLREFVKLGDLYQSIDIKSNLAVNRVEFAVSGLGFLSGSLTIRATYEPVSRQRVNIVLQDSSLVPEQLQKLFEKNYDMLLGIFNPAGYLDITYLDDTHRVGRDDKGNVFLLERVSRS